jgi:hypothetical protein
MNGKIRIERELGIIDVTNGKQIYIPIGAKFRAANESKVIVTVTTSQAGLIQADQNEIILDASGSNDFSGIVIGATDHTYRQSYCSSDLSPGKPDGMYDWKQACLIATPVAPFTD